MTPKKVIKLLNDDNATLSFEDIANKLATRQDLHAFMLLDKLVPSSASWDMVSAAEHDEIFLDVTIEDLAKVATENDIRELEACGVMYSEDHDCLTMFV